MCLTVTSSPLMFLVCGGCLITCILLEIPAPPYNGFFLSLLKCMSVACLAHPSVFLILSRLPQAQSSQPINPPWVLQNHIFHLLKVGVPGRRSGLKFPQYCSMPETYHPPLWSLAPLLQRAPVATSYIQCFPHSTPTNILAAMQREGTAAYWQLSP